MAVAHKYKNSTWVSVPLMHQLHLSPRRRTPLPVRLAYANSCCTYYNVSQLVESEEVICQRWAAQQHVHPEKQLVALPSSSSSSASTSDMIFLNTHGERFDAATEAIILAQHQQQPFSSPYWTTKDEAAYVFGAPFDAHHPRAREPVRVQMRMSGGAWVLLHNAEASSKPQAFGPHSCIRYDPYNYMGVFYRPATAVMMKRYAIKHGCLHERRWMTPHRIRNNGCQLRRGVEVLNFFFDDQLTQLANIATTCDAHRLEMMAVCGAADGVMDDAELLAYSGHTHNTPTS